MAYFSAKMNPRNRKWNGGWQFVSILISFITDLTKKTPSQELLCQN